MDQHDWVLMAVWTVVIVLVVCTVCDVIADRHRRGLPDEAWQSAGVDRLIWGRIGVRMLNLPFANVYYLLKIRPRLNAAVTDIILNDKPPTSP